MSNPPKVMLYAMVMTIPKPGKSPDEVSNYRPISLLNCDIKIFLKLLAEKVNEILPSLVHRDQVGFVQNRQATDDTCRI